MAGQILPPHLQSARNNDSRQDLAAMLKRQAFNSGSIQSPWQGIAQLGSAYFAGKKQDEINDDYSKQGADYNKALGAVLTGKSKDYSKLGPAGTQFAMRDMNQADKKTAYNQTRTDKLTDATTAHNRNLEVAGLSQNKPLTREAKAQADFLGKRIDDPTYRAILANAGKSGVTVTNTGPTQQTAMEKALGQQFATDYTSRAQQASTAAGTVGQLDILTGLLDSGLQTGFGQPFIEGARQLGAQLGLDVDRSQMAGAELYKAISTKMILPLVKQLGVNPTDKDLAFVVQGSAELSKSPEGNRLIIQALKRDQQRKIGLAQLQSKYYQAKKTMVGFANVEANYIQQNPIFNDQERTQLAGLRGGSGVNQSGATSPKRRRYNPQTGGLEEMGGDPLAGAPGAQINNGRTNTFPLR